MRAEQGSLQRTLARFFRHSVQAFGVTMPKPRLRLAFCKLVFVFWVGAVVAEPVEDMVGVGVPELPEVDWPCGVFPVLD